MSVDIKEAPPTASIPAPAIAVPPAKRTKIKVVLFSGGSGTHSITEVLRQHPQIDLRILINAYDDGHSTGRLRRFFPGMLGPSDVRKNVSRLMPVTERCQRSLKTLSDIRLPIGATPQYALNILDAICTGDLSALPQPIAETCGQLDFRQWRILNLFLQSFVLYHRQQLTLGRTFDFTDCALGNLIFAGCYVCEKFDFNATVRAFCALYEVPANCLVNITQGENLFLVAAKEDGTVLLQEGDIVSSQSSAKIRELFLVDQNTFLGSIEGHAEPAGGWMNVLRQGSRSPRLNPEAAAALLEADVIVYGPGTQHSSLFPSYLTESVAESIAANKRADKIFVGNTRRDFDIPEDDMNDLARKFMDTMNRRGQNRVDWQDLVTQFLVQTHREGAETEGKFIPFRPSEFPYQLDTVRVRNWESSAGRHSGGFFLDQIRQAVQSRIDLELTELHHLITIIVPALNEEKTLHQVLESLVGLDFQSLGLSKEILVVDGGSTDNTCQIARSVRGVRLLERQNAAYVKGSAGMGSALRRGIEAARGNYIAFFPSDGEYLVSDLFQCVATLPKTNSKAVFGTRSVKVLDLSKELKRIYEKSQKLYLTSKYGGMLLSVLTLLLYNRYVTDILTSVKVFDGALLRSLHLESKGREIDTEIVAKLALRHEYLLELPVEYAPRTRSQGKKISVLDGLRSLLTLIRYRLAA